MSKEEFPNSQKHWMQSEMWSGETPDVKLAKLEYEEVPKRCDDLPKGLKEMYGVFAVANIEPFNGRYTKYRLSGWYYGVKDEGFAEPTPMRNILSNKCTDEWLGRHSDVKAFLWVKKYEDYRAARRGREDGVFAGDGGLRVKLADPAEEESLYRAFAAPMGMSPILTSAMKPLFEKFFSDHIFSLSPPVKKKQKK